MNQGYSQVTQAYYSDKSEESQSYIQNYEDEVETINRWAGTAVHLKAGVLHPYSTLGFVMRHWSEKFDVQYGSSMALDYRNPSAISDTLTSIKRFNVLIEGSISYKISSFNQTTNLTTTFQTDYAFKDFFNVRLMGGFHTLISNLIQVDVSTGYRAQVGLNRNWEHGLGLQASVSFKLAELKNFREKIKISHGKPIQINYLYN